MLKISSTKRRSRRSFAGNGRGFSKTKLVNLYEEYILADLYEKLLKLSNLFGIEIKTSMPYPLACRAAGGSAAGGEVSIRHRPGDLLQMNMSPQMREGVLDFYENQANLFWIEEQGETYDTMRKGFLFQDIALICCSTDKCLVWLSRTPWTPIGSAT